jgi:putative phage-type endonuclease
MPITEAQLAKHKDHIGSSDVPAILGISPWSNAHKVWLLKTGRLTDDFEESEAAALGKMLENELLDWGAAQKDLRIRKNQQRVSKREPVLIATHDALVVDQPIQLEAKTTGLIFPSGAKELWGEPGTDEVPDYVLAQIQQQMFVSDLELTYVPAIIGGKGRLLYEVKRDQDLIDMIVERCMDFWTRNVIADTPPDVIPPMDALKQRIRTERAATVIPDTLVIAWKQAKQAAKLAKEIEEDLEARMLTALGDAEFGMTNRVGQIEYRLMKASRFDHKAFLTAHPEYAGQFMKDSPYRRLFYKEPKA